MDFTEDEMDLIDNNLKPINSYKLFDKYLNDRFGSFLLFEKYHWASDLLESVNRKEYQEEFDKFIDKQIENNILCIANISFYLRKDVDALLLGVK